MLEAAKYFKALPGIEMTYKDESQKIKIDFAETEFIYYLCDIKNILKSWRYDRTGWR